MPCQKSRAENVVVAIVSIGVVSLLLPNVWWSSKMLGTSGTFQVASWQPGLLWTSETLSPTPLAHSDDFTE
eukprot:CAMPEP_0204446298 /NCGR_PEP_ID=MMETSP0470-20130426/94471_1 /ASSEMBLY_ACC=CAM_ASM_000385 /TAXON_ID=2969 /ORGANISM="Oxyrrhis marina" /LENGTH=70 /DNA_ID=CAMNT_0051445865 /DNA_START=353 /DNA_END=562 /DNA_ORIENTATION=-